MSLFGYPATVTHYHSGVDDWGRPLPPAETVRAAKVVEEQRLIKNAKGEEIQVAYAIHIEGAVPIGFDDYFLYSNQLGAEIRIDVQHYEIRKYLGTDDVKKVIAYC
ncbi:hypothetical protein [Paenibacillus agri]|uniref:Uncharacterized protein n=1 Tax=Paenibacillus agri TaxID=2744309 RepID=A0A850EQD3_9BACL|nr:hypothetical protein [Paenibacillus agri]NUU62696.1 hypothetical protein [Paenibacillus agri]